MWGWRMRLYAEMYDTHMYNIQSSLRKLGRKAHGNSLKTIKSVLKTLKKLLLSENRIRIL